MRRFLTVLTAASALAFIAQPASAMVITPGAPGPAVFVVSGNPFTGTDSVTATIGNTVLAGTPAVPQSFLDDFQFTIGPPGGALIGTGSGSIITSTSLLFSSTDLDFTSVTVNGVPVAIIRTGGTLADGLFENAATSNVPIFSGQLNHITVAGLSRGLGSYGGNVTFTPGAVPEPATWAMMLVGFGAVGISMRRSRKSSARALQAA